MLPAVYERLIDYRDGDLTFFVHAHRDADPLAWMLGLARQLYPGARVVVCSDGDDDPRIAAAAEGVRAEFYLGDRLFGIESGGKICHRMLTLFFRRPTRFLFKVDPDTGFHRRFTYLPAHSGLFGTLQSMPALCSVQGGCLGFSYAAAEVLYRSAAFLDPGLADPLRTWAQWPGAVGRAVDRRLASIDWMAGYVATALGVPMFGFPEVRTTWQTYVPNPDLRYAITHPCKEMRL